MGLVPGGSLRSPLLIPPQAFAQTPRGGARTPSRCAHLAAPQVHYAQQVDASWHMPSDWSQRVRTTRPTSHFGHLNGFHGFGWQSSCPLPSSSWLWAAHLKPCARQRRWSPRSPLRLARLPCPSAPSLPQGSRLGRGRAPAWPPSPPSRPCHGNSFLAGSGQRQLGWEERAEGWAGGWIRLGPVTSAAARSPPGPVLRGSSLRLRLLLL